MRQTSRVPGVLVLLVAAAMLVACSSQPKMPTEQVKRQVVMLDTATSAPMPEPTATLPADTIITYGRSGGIAGIKERWTIHADGQVVDVAGNETWVSVDAVAALIRQAEEANFFDMRLGRPGANSCRDCFIVSLAVVSGGRKNGVTFVEGDETVPTELRTLTAAVRALVTSE